MLKNIDQLLENRQFDEINKIDFENLSFDELDQIEEKATNFSTYIDPDEDGYIDVAERAREFAEIKAIDFQWHQIHDKKISKGRKL